MRDSMAGEIIGKSFNVGDVYIRNPHINTFSSGIPAAYFEIKSEPYAPDPKYGNWIVVDAAVTYDYRYDYRMYSVGPIGTPVNERVNVNSMTHDTGMGPMYVRKEDEEK